MDPQPQNSELELNFLLERFEERNAILRNEAVGEIRWPIRLLPEELKVGDSVMLKLATPKQNEQEKYKLMRRLLEEIIN